MNADVSEAPDVELVGINQRASADAEETGSRDLEKRDIFEEKRWNFTMN